MNRPKMGRRAWRVGAQLLGLGLWINLVEATWHALHHEVCRVFPGKAQHVAQGCAGHVLAGHNLGPKLLAIEG